MANPLSELSSSFPALRNALGRIFGGSRPLSSYEKAPPLIDYPYGHSDIEQAKEAGFDYGTGWEGYLSGNIARRLPRSASGLTLKQTMDLAAQSGVTPHDPRPKGTQNLGDVLYAAALAANRNPITALGFDPAKVVFDPSPTHKTFGGLYSPGKDVVYANPFDASAVAHESTHRGFNALRDLGHKIPDDEELAVRWLMEKLAGAPESKFYDEMGFRQDAEGRKQIKAAKARYDASPTELDELMRAAERAIAAKPKGHR